MAAAAQAAWWTRQGEAGWQTQSSLGPSRCWQPQGYFGCSKFLHVTLTPLWMIGTRLDHFIISVHSDVGPPPKCESQPCTRAFPQPCMPRPGQIRRPWRRICAGGLQRCPRQVLAVLWRICEGRIQGPERIVLGEFGVVDGWCLVWWVGCVMYVGV